MKRIQSIKTDAKINVLFSMAQSAAKLDEIDAPNIYVEADMVTICTLSSERITDEDKVSAMIELALIIFQKLNIESAFASSEGSKHWTETLTMT